MKRIDLFIAILSSVMLLQGCNWFGGQPDPEDMETYTWQGTLYKGLGEAPWGNANLTLTGQERKGSGIKYHILATGETDANGNFVLSYERERDWHLAGKGQVDLEVNGGYPIMWAPWNTNVDREMCQNDHSEVVIHFLLEDSISLNDSLFISLKPMTKNDKIVSIENNLQAVLGPLRNHDEIQFKVAVTSSHNHSGSKIGLAWGRNDLSEKKDFFYLRGWPYIDTLYLQF